MKAGFGTQTHLHAVGDGAPWIAAFVTDKFGSQGNYLLDFYHLCEYLGAAAKSCANDDNEKSWLENQKNALKNNEYKKVLNNLKPYLETSVVDDSKAPVRACYRNDSNRTNQLDYKTAIEKGLPIGSGEIVRFHRYVIQERLKLPGAWFQSANADSMLAWSKVRANNRWNEYWETVAKAA